MRYWRDREVSDRLRCERIGRKDKRDGKNDTQLAGGIGFQLFNEETFDD